MSVFDNPKYDDARRWIQKKFEKGVSWDVIRLACKDTEEALKKFLINKSDEDDWPEMSVSEWVDLVDENEEYESRQQAFQCRGSEGALFDTKQDNGLSIPEAPRSCWQLYRKNLNWQRESVTDLEDATIGILRRLSKDTKSTGPIKGLVIGHVQSGKTANMEALMAMAADHGWNMFIVLSGTIENLRLQTLRRMQKDLNHEGNLIWHGVEHPSKKSQYGDRAVDFHFEEGAQSRYFTVCLKNAARLKKLIDWLHADKASHEQMRILIIDDEADQASISNTATEYNKEKRERKGINKLIVDLVEDKHYKKDGDNGKALAINYVMYTATPYANFLNEFSEESLYPRHFIWTLKTSREYIGPTEIFGSSGSDSDGLDIKRIITDAELDLIKSIYDGHTDVLPDSLMDSICWFICAVAVMRYRGYKKPISMLVHTSQKQDYHSTVAKAISDWINANRTDTIIRRCESIYNQEVIRLPKSVWKSQIPEYSIPEDQIMDYPEYEIIAPFIEEVLSDNIRHINMTGEGDLQYHKVLHLVIDNCSQNGLRASKGDGGYDHVRLAYPDPDMDPYPTPAPAFIIVGGSTLSRGLTIEGLVSTFFLRASCQADTLMQMGRWFGYRRGYEILPRIWMTKDTIRKFVFLSDLEIELRHDLQIYMQTEVLPIEYGPRVKASPKASWLRITSRNHMKNAVPATMDFSGARPQTTIFDRSESIQRANIAVVENFIDKLPGSPEKSSEGNSLFWRDVPLELILKELIDCGFSFCSRSRVFNEIGAFCEWIKKVVSADKLNRWSVIVAGKGMVYEGAPSDEKHWEVSGYSLGKVNRSRKTNCSDNNFIDIGVLRSISDCVADVPWTIVRAFKNEHCSISRQEDVDAIRKKAEMEDVPLLLIYRIDKDSKAQNANGHSTRAPLDMPCDIMGLQICVPGEQFNKDFCIKLTINLPEKDKEDEVEES